MPNRFQFTSLPKGNISTLKIDVFERMFVYERPNRKPMVWGFFVALGLVTILFFTLFQSIKPITNTSQSFVSSLQQKNYEQAYAMTTTALQQKVSLSQFQQQLLQYDLAKTIGTAELPTVKNNGTTSIIQGTLYTSNQEPRPMSLTLKKINQVWKIDQILIGTDPFNQSSQMVLQFGS